MSVEEGLNSTDVDVLAQARGIAKGKVTKTIKTLKLLLIQDDNKAFLIDEINEAEVDESHSKLKKNFDDFLEIHERYCVYRTHLDDHEQERNC